ncbi:MAG: phage tail terminator-like protein [Phycisphaerae bacterium]
MTFEEIRLAIESRLADWDDAPVAFDNVATQPSVQTAIDDKDPWVRLTINHGDSVTGGIGSSPCVRRTGLIQCQVFVDTDAGTKGAAELADSLAEQLQYWRDGGLYTLAASMQRVGHADGWYQINVAVPFRAD